MKASGGNVALMFALVVPLLLGFAGAGVDFQRWHMQKRTLQEFSDTLALRGAREFLLANASEAEIKSMIEATARQGLAEQFSVGEYQLDVTVSKQDATVSVNVTSPAKPGLLLTKISPYKDDLAGNSVAVASGGANVCVVALEEDEEKAISATWQAKMQADDCAIYSNSTSVSGIYGSGSAKLTAHMICSAGGKSGSESHFDPSVVTDCPIYEDPLAKRAAPKVMSCDEQDLTVGERNLTNFSSAMTASMGELAPEELDDGASEDDQYVNAEKRTLNPGVYCGGIDIALNADVTLNPGVYIIKDGPLIVDMQSRLQGENVAFYLVGDESTFFFAPDSKISLTAPKEGLLAGILFFEDRNVSESRVHRILSDDARVLLGTFYLPKSVLSVSSLRPVADQSAYTAIVARKVDMKGSPTLVLNTDYSLTDVPVPDGVGPVGGDVRLRQ